MLEIDDSRENVGFLCSDFFLRQTAQKWTRLCSMCSVRCIGSFWVSFVVLLFLLTLLPLRIAFKSPQHFNPFSPASNGCILFRESEIFRIFFSFSRSARCRAQLGSSGRTTVPEAGEDREAVLRVVAVVEEALRAEERKESMMVDRRRSPSRPRRDSSLLVSKPSAS